MSTAINCLKLSPDAEHNWLPWQLMQVQKQRAESVKVAESDSIPNFNGQREYTGVKYQAVTLTDTEFVSVRVCTRCGERETK